MFVALVIVSLLMVGAAKAESEVTFQESVRPLAVACQSSTKATDADVENLVNLHADFTPQGECLVFCVAGNFGVLHGDVFAPRSEVLQIYNRLFADDPKRLAKGSDVVNNCLSSAERKFRKQHCKMAADALFCLLTTTA